MNTDKIIAEAIAKDYAPKDNSIVTEWVKNDCQKDIEEIAAIMYSCIFGREGLLVN